MATRAADDPFLTKAALAQATRNYLSSTADPRDPVASALYGDLDGLPPIRIDVGEAEILFDDSQRYHDRAIAAGVDCRLHIWQGMPHVFPANVGTLEASTVALADIAGFLRERFD